jgi:hypothetical protein
MADQHRPAGTGDTGGAGGSPPRMPRWVKVAALIAGVLVGLFLALQLAGFGGEHGPGRHRPGGHQDQQTHDPTAWAHGRP